MDDAVLEQRLENLDRSLARIEQVLPTLATKDELRVAIEPLATKEELRVAIEPLATKEELRVAIEPLATKEELRVAIEPLATREDLRELRRYMDVLSESQRGDIQLLAEHLTVVMSRLNDR